MRSERGGAVRRKLETGGTIWPRGRTSVVGGKSFVGERQSPTSWDTRPAAEYQTEVKRSTRAAAMDFLEKFKTGLDAQNWASWPSSHNPKAKETGDATGGSLSLGNWRYFNNS